MLQLPPDPVDAAQKPFDFSCWTPQPGVGTSFLGPLPVGCEALSHGSDYQQSDTIGKMKVSTAHRKTRQKEFTSGQTTKKNIHGNS